MTIHDLLELRRDCERDVPPLQALGRDGSVVVDEHVVVCRPSGPDVPVISLRPATQTSPAPAIFHLHGGAMVLGTNRDGTDQLADWVEQFGVVVLAPDYRLAPENPYPAAIDDCYAALLWVVDNAYALGVDPARIVVAGVSAGGGLAASLALMSRDRQRPRLMGQLLMCPMLDDRNESPSSIELDGVGFWDRTSNLAAWNAFLGGRAGRPDVSPYAAPARSNDLSRLPPAFLDVGSVEVFRDEVVEYASRLWQAGGDAELHVWPGGFHGFDAFAPQADLSRSAIAARATWLSRLLC